MDLNNLEAPPGFEPGMEVLQTSALPLGDGADRKDSCAVLKIRPAEAGLYALHLPANERPAPTSARSGAGDEASVVERAGAARGRAVIKFGAGNGIRTRDFDLGKVALYH